MDQCQLCEKPGVLRDSHIVPEFLYKDLYNEKRHMMGINGKGKSGWKALQKGLREKLFCDGCEQLLNDRYEKPFVKYWRDNNPLPQTLKPGELIEIQVPDYTSFKLFHLSIFFRAAISSLPTYRDANLNEKHVERLRELILNCDPGKHWEYMVFGNVLTHHDSFKPVAMVSQPYPRRLDGNKALGMIYGKVAWYITTISHRAKAIEEVALSTNGVMPLMAVRWDTHEVLKAASLYLN